MGISPTASGERAQDIVSSRDNSSMNTAMFYLLPGAFLGAGITFLILGLRKSSKTETTYNRTSTGGTVTENGTTRAMTEAEMKKVDEGFKLASEAFTKASEAFDKLP